MLHYRTWKIGIVLLAMQSLGACNSGGRPSIEDGDKSGVNQGGQDIDLGPGNQTGDANGQLQFVGIPEGRTDLSEFQVEVSSQDFSGFVFKYGPAESVRCADSDGYSDPLSLSESFTVSTSDFEDGYMKLCALGLKDNNQRQQLSRAVQAVWVRESEPTQQEEIDESLINLDPENQDPNVLSSSPYVVNCNQEQSVRALNSVTPRNVIFANAARNDGTDQVYRIYWINYSGARVLLTDLNPGFQILIRGFETHPWLIADVAGNCKGIYVTIRDDIFVIDLK